LATTEILMMAVQAGIGREQGHSIIKKYSVAEALQMRKEGHAPALAEKLAQDPVFKKAGITADRIRAVLKDQEHFLGNAKEQIKSVMDKAEGLLRSYPDAAQYEPGEIL
jgi:adenylosuccinate lyase